MYTVGGCILYCALWCPRWSAAAGLVCSGLVRRVAAANAARLTVQISRRETAHTQAGQQTRLVAVPGCSIGLLRAVAAAAAAAAHLVCASEVVSTD